MGNRQAGQKQKDGKTKDDKKKEKETKKEQERQKKKDKKGKKKNPDIDNSSHVTGADSESSVFHSAENVSASPYLDACTRSELEQGPGGAVGVGEEGWGWGAVGAASSVSYYQLHQHHRHHEFQQQHHHPMVLSSKDFRDGFSLEACIPPEIARRDVCYADDASTASARASQAADVGGRDRSGSSVKSKRSNTGSVKSRSSKASSVAATAMISPSSQHATPTSLRSRGDDSSSMTSSQTSAGGAGGAGYSTPLLSTPVFSRADRTHSPNSTLTRVQESDPFDLSQYENKVKVGSDKDMTSQQSQPSASFHHPHFFNHQRSYRQGVSQQSYPTSVLSQQQQQQREAQQQQSQQHTQFHDLSPDFRNLPKPTSPHPQRRALSPKMASAPLKLISSDDSSSSPTTPVPQRKAGNFLDIFRSSGKKGDKSSKKSKLESSVSKGEKAAAREKHGGKSDSSTNTNESEQGEKKGRAKWKTWERASAKKITGDKQSKVSMIFGTVRKTDKSKKTSEKKEDEKGVKVGDVKDKKKGKENQSNGAKSAQRDSEDLNPSSNISGNTSPSPAERNSSPPMVKSAAVCIMKLEELERNIEKTIREKFPGAEPFLLKKRSKEDLKGSRSLPTTPSLKKKLYVAQHADNGNGAGESSDDTRLVASNLRAVSSKLSEHGTTRWCDETYESPPSPAMSPVVLRRFGARTRHASISPKIQRAKTAALYNSPSEISRLNEASNSESRTVTTVVPQYHAVRTGKSPALSPLIANSLTSTQKSSSKYDNVNDDSDEDHDERRSIPSSQLMRQRCVDEYDSDEVEESFIEAYDAAQQDQNQKPVIVPTFSAVFGSVSPKLKRHLQAKFDDINKTQRTASPARNISGLGGSLDQKYNLSSETKDSKPSGQSLHLKDVKSFSVDSSSASAVACRQVGVNGKQTSDLKQHTAVGRKGDSQTNVSVRDRVQSINKSLSQGPAPHENENGNVSRETRTLPQAREITTHSTSFTIPAQSPGHEMIQHHATFPPSPGSSTAQVNTETSKSRAITSPGSARKHSIDHVVFGTAVALPCRVYAQPASSLGQEEHQVNSSTCAHAPVTPASPPTQRSLQSENNEKNVKKQKTGNREHSLASASLSPSTNVKDRKERGTPPSSAGGDVCSHGVRENAGSVFTQHSTSVSDQGQGLTNKPNVLNITPHETGTCASHSVVDSVLHGDRKALVSNQSYHVDSGSKTVSKSKDSIHVDRGRSRLKQDSGSGSGESSTKKTYEPEYKDEEQKFVVLRQPISQVISDMINTSKQQVQPQEPLQQPQNFQKQQQEKRPVEKPQKLHQSSPTSPEQELHVEHVVTMVSSQTFKQPCLTLEEKTVRSDSSVSLPSSPLSTVKRIERDFSPGEGQPKTTLSRESRSSSAQTESVSTAEKGVESATADLCALMEANNGKLEMKTQEKLRKDDFEKEDSMDEEGSTSSEDNDKSQEFIHKVISMGKTKDQVVTETASGSRTKEEGGASASEREEPPPPPSPTAMNQLLEEFEEEDEDDNGINERKEMEKSIQREAEMQQFTDKVFKRLSDLMGGAEREEEVFDDDVFEEEDITDQKKVELFSGTSVPGDEEIFEEFSDDDSGEKEPGENQLFFFKKETSSQLSSSQTSQGMKKVLTIQSSSSSLTTTTESSEDDDDGFILPAGLAQPPLPMTPEIEERPLNVLEPMEKPEDAFRAYEMAEGAPKKKTGPNYFVFPEYDHDRPDMEDSEEARRRRSASRDCHSDDDVARGQGIPDYYDDRPLWRRRQKPPGQLSLQMVAIRRRERRERWLRKRQRNKTDLLSTGSSDTGSETSLRYEHPRLKDPNSTIDYSYYEQSTSTAASAEPRNALGSGILTSPKYSKPIMPFLVDATQQGSTSNGGESPREVEEEIIRAKIASERLEATMHSQFVDEDGSFEEKHPWKSRHRDSFDHDSSSDDAYERGHEDGGVRLKDRTVREKSRSDTNLAIPGIEETFHELESVKHILEELQDRSNAPGSHKESGGKCMPLTKENIRSIHEYYKEDLSKSGRRSRMSIADRTESDLDIFSENQDDASSDSNVYADDEEDDDGADTYATADDDLAGGATGGSGSDTLGRRKPRRRHPDDDDNSYTNDDDDDDLSEDFVVSCTFYNSKTQPSGSASAVTGGGATPVADQSARPLIGSSGKSTSHTVTGQSRSMTASQISPVTGAPGAHSDEEFWSGSAAIEASYRQMETAADAVSSTFQNAREQMIDIQQHLQALRRQMEGLEDEITPSTSVTMTPDMS